MTISDGKTQGARLNVPHQLFIGGNWVDAYSGETFEAPNLATGEVLTEVASAGKEDIDRAVLAARQAFEFGAWKTMTPSMRGRLIWRRSRRDCSRHT